MTLFEPLGKAPDPSALAGFVPCPLEDDVARLLLRPLFDEERETLLLAAFDAFERLVRLERVDGDSTGRCVIPPRSWRTLLNGGRSSWRTTIPLTRPGRATPISARRTMPRFSCGPWTSIWSII